LRLPPANAVSITYRANLAEVRKFVWAYVAKAGLSPARTRDLVIAASELAANTLRHTTGGGIMHIWTAPGEILCQVHDSGHITDPEAGQVRPPPDAGHGHGLWIVHQLCDTVDIYSEPGGTTIRLHMRLGTELAGTFNGNARGRRT
jgi:anti-sigma regulatory factor (Ser/Thr protein kinase)